MRACAASGNGAAAVNHDIACRTTAARVSADRHGNRGAFADGSSDGVTAVAAAAANALREDAMRAVATGIYAVRSAVHAHVGSVPSLGPAATNGDAAEGSYGVAASSIPATAAKALGEDGAGIVLVIGQIANVDDRNRVGIAAAAAGTAEGKPAAARSAVAAAAADALRKDGFRLAVNGPRVEYIHFAAVTGAAAIAANRAQSGAKTSVAAAAAHALGINAFGPASVCRDNAVIGHVDVSAETAIGRAAAVSNQGAAATATAAATADALREDAMGIGAISNDLAAGFLCDIHFTATAGAVSVAALRIKNARLTATLAAKTANAFGINAV